MAKTSAQREAARYARKKQAGLAQLKLWAHPSDFTAIRLAAEKLKIKRALSEHSTSGGHEQ